MYKRKKIREEEQVSEFPTSTEFVRVSKGIHSACTRHNKKLQEEKMYMNQENNYVKVSGVVTEMRYSHEIYGEKFNYLTIEVVRQSGTKDELKVLISERLITPAIMWCKVTVIGEMRSYDSTWENGKYRTLIALFAKEIMYGDTEETEEDENEVFLEGILCKVPTYRVTPFGREISDIHLAINRAYGKSSYIPCIVWGRNARFASTLEIGQKLRLHGRFQSRKYTKVINGESVEMTAYEISVARLELIE